MKGLRAVEICILVMVLGAIGGVVHSSPAAYAEVQQQQQQQQQQRQQGRGVGGLGFPYGFFYDIKHQFGSIGHDLRKLVTSLMGATQVVYWKHPIQRTPAAPVRRADYSHRQSTTVSRPPAPRLPTTKRHRRKKAYTHTDDDDYDDFFSFDSFGLW